MLDLGCGLGRNAISLAKIDYDVTGIDSSKVGIQQLLSAVESIDVRLNGIVGDISIEKNLSIISYYLTVFSIFSNEIE